MSRVCLGRLAPSAAAARCLEGQPKFSCCELVSNGLVITGMAARCRINVPASTANLGPGWDVLGLALSLWLTIDIADTGTPSTKLNCTISCEGSGSNKISCDPEENMITRVALNVLESCGIKALPNPIHISINNQIPLGRGLGSSGAAIVGGVMLADVVADLKLSKDLMMDFCLVEENHPDNIGASLRGGFLGSFLEKIDSKSDSNGSVEQKISHSSPQLSSVHVHFPWSKAIKVIAVIPDYEVKTESARKVLPASYSKEDAVFNSGRVAMLTHLLGSESPDAVKIHKAMQDRFHQPYRTGLVYGLQQLLELTPDTMPGLLGLSLSGAGPTILALATHNFPQISDRIIRIIKDAAPHDIGCEWRLLDPAHDGAYVERGTGRQDP